MSEHLQPTELTRATNEISAHLLAEVASNPSFQDDPIIRFRGAVAAAAYTADPEATAMAWQTLREHSGELPSYDVMDFAEPFIRRGTPEDLMTAREISTHFSTKDEESGGTRSEVLVRIAETSTDNEVRQSVGAEAVSLLREIVSQGNGEGIGYSATDQLVRLGVATGTPEYIRTAAEGVDRRLKQLYLCEAASKALQTPMSPEVRQAVVDGIVTSQTKVASSPGEIASPRNGFAETMTEEELTRVVRAVKGTGNRHFVFDYSDNPDEIFTPKGFGKGLAAFNSLVTQLGAWDSPRERLRFNLRATRTRRELPDFDSIAVLGFISKHLGNILDKQYPGYGHVLTDARRLTEALDDPKLRSSPDTVDDILTNLGYSIKSRNEDYLTLNIGWGRFIRKVGKGSYHTADPDSVQGLHELRGRLPRNSLARIQLNVALLKSGDPSGVEELVQGTTANSLPVLPPELQIPKSAVYRFVSKHSQALDGLNEVATAA